MAIDGLRALIAAVYDGVNLDADNLIQAIIVDCLQHSLLVAI